MKFKKNPESTLKWWLCGLIPIVNYYWIWKVSKIVANLESERGD